MADIERIRFLRPMAGPRVNRRIGDKVFVGEDQPMDPLEARRLVDAGFAEVLRGDALAAKAEEPASAPEPEPEPEELAEDKTEPEIETATVGPEENAAKRTRRPRRKTKKRSKA